MIPKEHVEAIALHHLDDTRNDIDDIDDENGPDSAALLGPRSRTRGSERPSFRSTWIQVKGLVTEATPTLLLTTFSLTFTGELMDHVSRWRAMRKLDQLILIIPVVLNLNGNIEMNLSARLGTAANVGELDDPVVRRSMIVGNMALLQVQTIGVSFVAACFSLLLGMALPRHTTQHEQRNPLHSLSPRRPIPHPGPDSNHKVDLHVFVMVAGSAMSAASLSGLVLGSFMCILTVLCRVLGLDPDNIAPPIASCLGDLVTLSLLGFVSNILIPFLGTIIPFVVFLLVTSSAITCLHFTRRNSHVRGLLFQGWAPLFSAMVISCGTGIVLDLFVRKYEEFALLSVVISGLPGAVGSVYISRLSTSLHAIALHSSSFNGPVLDEQHIPSSGALQFSPRLTMVTLLLVTLPVEIIFLSILKALGWLHASSVFVALSVFFFCCAVLASLLIGHLLTSFLWNRGLDPDMYALPIHSALMDLVGQALLILCFEVVGKATSQTSYA